MNYPQNDGIEAIRKSVNNLADDLCDWMYKTVAYIRDLEKENEELRKLLPFGKEYPADDLVDTMIHGGEDNG